MTHEIEMGEIYFYREKTYLINSIIPSLVPILTPSPIVFDCIFSN
jgi:hypothetical protein